MNDKHKEANDDDIALFRQAMGDVKPLKPVNKVSRNPAARKPRRRPDRAIDELPQRFGENALTEECPDHLLFARAGGVQKSVLKKLRNGKLAIDAMVDLHGMTIDQASQQLTAFLNECRRLGHRHVLIVHGKGFRSANKPVIKPMVNRWLRQADEVLAFCSAQPKDGGTGAVYGLLRKSREE